MSPLTIILLVLILAIGRSTGTEVHTTMRRSEAFPSNNRSFSLPERVNYYTLNVSAGEKDPAAVQRSRLRQDLQHLMSAMVRKIIHKRRFKQAKSPETGSAEAKSSRENKIATGDYPDGIRLGAFEGSSRRFEDRPGGHPGAKIGERTSMDLSRVSERLMPLVRGSLKTGSRGARDRREQTGKPPINRENVVGRVRRNSRVTPESRTDAWMTRDFGGRETTMKMHAFVVRDEDVPPCCSPAKEVTYVTIVEQSMGEPGATMTSRCNDRNDVTQSRADNRFCGSSRPAAI